jgi:two-component system LytT family response regulator
MTRMIRVMVVDDETPALKQAERVLRTFVDVQICGLFTDPDEFLEHLLAEPVDLVLLDMEMPDYHGLELARRIQSSKADVSIAFVTAYDEYAVDAFEADAMDYLLKPITEERLRLTLHRCLQRKQRSSGNVGSSGGKEGVSIRCFGRFAIMTDNGESVKFRNSKSEELLAYLVHHNGEPVGKVQIMEALWYGRDPVRTQANMHSTAYQLRKDLEAYGLRDTIEQSKGGAGSYRLRLSPDVSDLYEYEKSYRQCKNGAFDMAHAERAVDLYRNGYLKQHDYGWAAERQAELEFRYVELLEGIVNDYVQQKRYRNAVPIVQKWANLLPFSEHVHARMIALLLLMNHSEEARKYYDKVSSEIFANELGIVLDLNFEGIVANPNAWFDRTPDS